MKKQDERIQLTELFMAQADRDTRFYGFIKRLTDPDGVPYVFGEIRVYDRLICARAGNQQELGRKLDEMVRYVLRIESMKSKIPKNPLSN